MHRLEGNCHGNLEKRWILQNTLVRKKNLEDTGKNNFIDNRYINSNCRNQKAKNNNFKALKEKSCQNRILYRVKLSFTSEREIKTFQTKRLRQAASRRPSGKELSE